MIGNNQLRLNTDTVVEALQRYLDEVVFREGKRVRILSLEKENSGYPGGDSWFVVKVEPANAEPAPPAEARP